MRKYFYYHRDKDNAPLVTVCLIKWRTVVCRGVAICSPLDNPEKREGRYRAEGRALSAYKRRKTTEQVLRDEVIVLLFATEAHFEASYYNVNKSVYKPELTTYEKKILKA